MLAVRLWAGVAVPEAAICLPTRLMNPAVPVAAADKFLRTARDAVRAGVPVPVAERGLLARLVATGDPVAVAVITFLARLTMEAVPVDAAEILTRISPWGARYC